MIKSIGTLGIVLLTHLQESLVSRDILFIYERGGEGLAILIYNHVERLGVCAELGALQIAPFVAVCTESALSAVGLRYLDRFGQGFLFIHHQSDKNEIIVDRCLDIRIRPYGSFHLTAVDASVAREVEQHGFVELLSQTHTLFEVIYLSMDIAFEK